MKFTVNFNGMPDTAARQGPEVGDVFKKDGGPAGFMIIVSDNGSVYGYLAVNMQGEVTGVGQGNAYYFSRRCFVGRVENFNLGEVQWET